MRHDNLDEVFMTHGTLTMQVARILQKEFIQQGFVILHDHGERGIDPPKNLGKLRSWFGDKFESETILADLDIAVVSHNKVYALIEIEETTDKPKVILGDVLAILLGKGIAFQSKHDLQVGKYTTMVVMVRYANQSHSNRIAFLAEQANYIRTKLLTPNASIREIVVDTFSDPKQLENKLRHHINNALTSATHSE